jgi:hypothetical protein
LESPLFLQIKFSTLVEALSQSKLAAQAVCINIKDNKQNNKNLIMFQSPLRDDYSRNPNVCFWPEADMALTSQKKPGRTFVRPG